MQCCVFYRLNRLLCDYIILKRLAVNVQVGVLHNDLATALDGGGQLLSDAESHARTSLEILSQSRSRDTEEYLARVYYNLGMILSHQGQFLF